MASSGLEAGAIGASAAYADAHLERCPQSPCPGSADTGSVGRRRRTRRGARGARLQFGGPLALSGTTFFSSTTCSPRCPTGLLPTLLAPRARSPSTRCSSTACLSVGGIFYNITGILSSAAEVLCSPSNSRHIISEHTTHALILPCTSFQSPSHVHTSATPSRTPFPH